MGPGVCLLQILSIFFCMLLCTHVTIMTIYYYYIHVHTDTYGLANQKLCYIQIYKSLKKETKNVLENGR